MSDEERAAWVDSLARQGYEAMIDRRCHRAGTRTTDYSSWDDHLAMGTPMVDEWRAAVLAIEAALYDDARTLPGRVRQFSPEARALDLIRPRLEQIRALVQVGDRDEALAALAKLQEVVGP